MLRLPAAICEEHEQALSLFTHPEGRLSRQYFDLFNRRLPDLLRLESEHDLLRFAGETVTRLCCMGDAHAWEVNEPKDGRATSSVEWYYVPSFGGIAW